MCSTFFISESVKKLSELFDSNSNLILTKHFLECSSPGASTQTMPDEGFESDDKSNSKSTELSKSKKSKAPVDGSDYSAISQTAPDDRMTSKTRAAMKSVRTSRLDDKFKSAISKAASALTPVKKSTAKPMDSLSPQSTKKPSKWTTEVKPSPGPTTRSTADVKRSPALFRRPKAELKPPSGSSRTATSKVGKAWSSSLPKATELLKKLPSKPHGPPRKPTIQLPTNPAVQDEGKPSHPERGTSMSAAESQWTRESRKSCIII